MKKSHFIGIVLVAALCIGGVIYSFFSKSSPILEEQSPAPVAQKYIPKESGREVPEGFAEYYTPQYHFSLLYPNNLTAAEHPEEGGAMTVTFEDIEEETIEGFQIFIVPFMGNQITDDRFKQDIPSGVRKELREVTIDGATGATFYSENDILGATAEVWFLRGGYLYEVNTFRELAPWLDNIMQTWQFET